MPNDDLAATLPLNPITSGYSDRKESETQTDKERIESNMRPLRWLFGLCVTPQAVGVLTGQDASSEGQPLPPSQDPWYRAPPGFDRKQPGGILKIRIAPGNLTSVVGNPSAAYHILYRTTDSTSKPSWAVTTLFIPPSFHFSPSGKAALLSYQFAYNTANLDSSPSIGLYWRLAQENRHLGLKSSTSLVNEMLTRGWIVNTPDYMGPDAAFGASKQAGQATIDSIRAVHNLANMTGNMPINMAIWGYSGGSIATLAAAQLAPRYAPELKIEGTVVGGLVDDISADFDNINKSPIAGTLIALLLGITAQYPEATAYLESRLVPETKTEFLSVRDMNAGDALPKFAGKDIYAYFIGGAEDLQAPILQKLYDDQAKLSDKGVPSMPIFVYKAIKDEYCPVEQTDSTVKTFCEAGADIRYDRNTVGSHVLEIENGKPRAMTWLDGIFNESHITPPSGCTVHNVSVDVVGKPS
ncbi:lipase 1 precursor protein [Pochonia chlamydosporia 170]|uniref:Lipase 1 protein n=1 Tax=Pochonia chlamydosporia 170 TaxID=1380566 RepID=A0A179F293_METCM|nr:lipase 1 precursor protein [Pochonia chlamydosporia 170]OAQ59562.1 lipase 1 precursor protein [Pochonia chlamydosporia 170]